MISIMGIFKQRWKDSLPSFLNFLGYDIEAVMVSLYLGKLIHLGASWRMKYKDILLLRSGR